MARVISTHTLEFTHASGTHRLIPSRDPQHLPDELLDHPHLLGAEKSGWVRIIDRPHAIEIVGSEPPQAEDTERAEAEASEPQKEQPTGKKKGRGGRKNTAEASEADVASEANSEPPQIEDTESA